MVVTTIITKIIIIKLTNRFIVIVSGTTMASGRKDGKILFVNDLTRIHRTHFEFAA